MQRSKQQALMFLLGAVLVGGVLGFSADRVFVNKPKHWAPRQYMYQDLELTETQIAAMDSLLDARNCQIRVVMRPVQPQLDSIKRAAHAQMQQILSAEQRAKLDARAGEERQRDSIRSARRDSLRAAGVSPNC